MFKSFSGRSKEKSEGEQTPESPAVDARLSALEAKIESLQNDLKAKSQAINVLKYNATLATRTMDSLFQSLYGQNLKDFQGRHKGQRCFVVGNGPSLNDIDMTRLQSEITLGSNRAFVGFDKWGFSYDYWMVQDRILAEQSAAEFATRLPDETVKFIPYTIIKFFGKDSMKNVVPVHLDYTKQCTFDADPACLHEGFTVTLGLLQIAAIMGFSQIIMVGVDHNYVIPEGNVNDDKKWSGKGLSNHFSDEYTNHDNGQVWEMPNIERMTRAYNAAAAWAAENGVEMLNASPGTKLEAFRKVKFDELF